MNDIYKISKESIDAAVQKMRVEGYESPIELFIQQRTEDSRLLEEKAFTENAVMTAVIECEVKVDRDELIRALNYDRKQYEVGYRSGLRAARRWGYWKQSYDGNGDRFTYTCSVCGEQERDNFTKHYQFCPYCGAQMLPVMEAKPFTEEAE